MKNSISKNNKSHIALAQIEVQAGHPDQNYKKICDTIAKARKKNAAVVVFPEMAVPGYLIGDRWESASFIRDVVAYNELIREASQGITVIWGSVWADNGLVGEDGRVRKYNAALVAADGKWISNGVLAGRTYKTLMPKYREFDDERHFYSLIKFAREKNLSLKDCLKPFPVVMDGKTSHVGVLLCEDIWSDDYADNPARLLIANGAELIVNISTSPWTWRKNDKRHRVVKNLLKDSGVPLFYVNAVGTQNNGKNIFLFDGNTTAYGRDGTVLAAAHDYEEGILTVDFPQQTATEIKPPLLSEARDTEELYQALIYGLKKFFVARASSRVVVGVSGGVDSALVATLLTLALGADNVFAVNMPSQFNSHLTKDAAAELCRNLGCHYAITSIQNLVDATMTQLAQIKFVQQNKSKTSTPLTITDLMSENIQARHRGSTFLSAIAAGLGAVYTNNSNKTETAIGYATLYGDVNGAIAPIADLYKAEVYQLARYINIRAGQSLIPETILALTPSAELSAAQNVEEGKGDPIHYPYHDKLLRAFIEFRREPEDILALYLEGTLDEKLKLDPGTVVQAFADANGFINDLEEKWRLFNVSIFKRVQTPPIITVSRRAFGFDLREAQNGTHFTREYLRLKAIALG